MRGRVDLFEGGERERLLRLMIVLGREWLIGNEWHSKRVDSSARRPRVENALFTPSS